MIFQLFTLVSLSLLLNLAALAATSENAVNPQQATTVQTDTTATTDKQQKPLDANAEPVTPATDNQQSTEQQEDQVPNLDALAEQADGMKKKKKEYPITPITHHGKKWRLGYYQGGPYDSYQKTLEATVEGLMELGWIKTAILPQQEDPKAVRPLWEWLVKNISSEYVEFVDDAFYSFDWDDSKRVGVKQELIKRLNSKADIDLMLVMGTPAGQDVANNEHSVPSIIGSTTDALAANIIKSVDDSGYDHIFAKIDPTRHEQQVWLFRKIIGFNKLGIIYENSEEGRSFAAIDSVERVARREGFDLVRCYARNKDLDPLVAEKNLIRCYQRIASKVDAVYVTRNKSATPQNLPARLEPLFEKHIPSFSQTGDDEVKYGVLLSMALSSYRPLGIFYATVIAKIFNGAKPRELPQLFKNPPKIAINLATAKAIDYDPPIEILGAADIIYQNIDPPPPAVPPEAKK